MFDRAELGQRLLLISGQNLSEHARYRIERQHARRQLDLPPRERSSIRVHRRRRRDDVRLLADVHHERVTFETNDCVEQGVEQLHNVIWPEPKTTE